MCYGNADCYDQSDEDSALCYARLTCSADQWKCKDGFDCIEEWRVCDGDAKECRGGSDEDVAVCAQWNCTSGYVKYDDERSCYFGCRIFVEPPAKKG